MPRDASSRSPAEVRELHLAYQSHLANTVDLTFVGRYIVPIVIPVVVGGLTGFVALLYQEDG